MFNDSSQDNNNIIDNDDFNTYPIYSIIKDNLFLGSYKTISDILSSIKSDKKWIITKNCFYSALSGLDKFLLLFNKKNLKNELLLYIILI